MIEVKVPVDFEAMQVKGKNGLTPKTRNYAIFAAATVLPLALFGDRLFHPEVANILIMIIVALALLPIYLEKGGKTGISGEEMMLNIAHFFTNKQMRYYEDIDPIAQLDDEEEALRRLRQGKSKKSTKMFGRKRK
ncbi:MAG: hypothetical protein FWE34_05560 [Defluviitaleaceae bacterium]|nr:hypothetical protein [Defluviitaleaceae bacterium]